MRFKNTVIQAFFMYSERLFSFFKVCAMICEQVETENVKLEIFENKSFISEQHS